MSEQSGSATSTKDIVLATPNGRAADAFDAVLPSAANVTASSHRDAATPRPAPAPKTRGLPRFLIAVVAAVIVLAAATAAVAAIIIATNDTDDVTIGSGPVGVVVTHPVPPEVATHTS